MLMPNGSLGVYTQFLLFLTQLCALKFELFQWAQFRLQKLRFFIEEPINFNSQSIYSFQQFTLFGYFNLL